jgi:glycosyltransferase involved in cell wall biosynthesis
MKAVTVHRGARDGYQVAHALHEAGILETLVTDLYWPGERGWAGRIDRVLPGRARAAFNCRHAGGLPSSAVTSCALSGATSLAVSKARYFPFRWQRDAVRWCDRSLGRRAGQIATRTGAALLSYSYYAHSAFSNYDGGGPRILFQLHPHPASVRAVLMSERNLHPECAPSLDVEWELALPESDFKRLAEETAMAQYWIAASTYTKSTLTDSGIPAERIAVIPYGIDTSRFSPAGKTFSSSRRPLRLLFVGTMGQRKGIKYLVEAVNMLPPGTVELTVCGRPVDDMALFRRSRTPIRVRPSIGARELLEEYRAADVFVFPSLAEGFAHVLLEAMASGLPIISTARTAAPDLIRHGCEGYIAETGSAGSLATLIEAFLFRPDSVRAMGEAARRRAEGFTWERFRGKVAEFVGGVLNSRGARSSKTCLTR